MDQPSFPHSKQTTTTPQRALSHLGESRFGKADQDLQQALDLVMQEEETGEGLSLPGVEEQVGGLVWFVGRLVAHVRTQQRT
jgi:hypothetical protein